MISAEETDHAQAADPSLLPGDYVRIKVVDTGVAMGPGIGTGLGLSAVQDIAAQSGGLLRIESAPSMGTAALLWLPRFSGYPIRRKPDQSATDTGLSARWVAPHQ
jgi:signal transduction histidine kinase